MHRFRSSSSNALWNVKAACCTLSSHVLFYSMLNTYWKKTGKNCGTPEAVHSVSWSRLINCLCFGRSIYALATENVPAQQFTTGPPGRVKLQTSIFIHNMFFCIWQSSIWELDELEPARKTRLSCSRRWAFDICKVYLGYELSLLSRARRRTRMQVFNLTATPYNKDELLAYIVCVPQALESWVLQTTTVLMTVEQ